ncbi:MAG: LysM domain-containing protein, partial [Verrucomicrobiota bacterium]
WLYEEKIKDYAAAIYHYQRHLALAPKSPRSQRVTDEIRGCKLDLVKTEFTLPSSQSLQQEVESLTQKNLLLQQQLDAARTLASAAASPPPQPGRAPTSAPAVSAPAPAPPPAPAPLPPVPDLSHPRLYVVQSHDTINSVATRYGLKPGVVLAANPNINPTRLRIGQTLNLP